MKYRYRNITWIKPYYSNCLLFALWYWMKKDRGKISAEFDRRLCFYHFYISVDDKEIHFEQLNRRQIWMPIIKVRIKIYQQKT